jgi:hypothetical protein
LDHGKQFAFASRYHCRDLRHDTRLGVVVFALSGA